MYEFGPKVAKASVTTYIRTKDEPGNKARIQQINNDLEQLASEFKTLEKEIADLVANNETHQTNIEEAKAGKLSGSAERKNKIAQTKTDINNCKKIIEDSKPLIEKTKSNGAEFLKEWGINHRKFQILINIAGLLKFPSSLVDKFVNHYKEFLGKYKKVLSSGEGKFDDISLTSDEDNISDEFKDPLTNRKIRVPVVTKAGTLFDENSLFEQFKTDKKEPFIFKHKDGGTEEIEYSQWQKMTNIQHYIDKKRGKVRADLASSINFFGSNQISREELIKNETEILREIEKLKEKLEENKIKLDRVRNQLQKLPDPNNNNNSFPSNKDYLPSEV
jgi:predicted RNase H-like nuclease (RuvC/YqgF family)